MRFAALLLIIFLCFPALNGFCADTSSQGAQSVQADYLIPLTSEIFDLLYGASIYLERLDYYLSAPIGIILEPPPKQEDILRIANGALLFDPPQTANPPLAEIILQSDARGKLKSFFGTPKGSEIFEVEFGEPGKTSLLQFRRNAKNDLFELFSVFDVSTAKNYLLRHDSIVPYLLIRSDRIGVTTQYQQSAPTPMEPMGLPPQSQSVPPQAASPSPLPSQPLLSFSAPAVQSTYTAPSYVPPPVVLPPVNAAPEAAQPGPAPGDTASASQPAIPPPEVSSRNDIMKKGSLSKNAIVTFVRSKNSSVDTAKLNALVDAYIAEADSEQINYDLAIAQMCYATNFLRNQDRMLIHDYAALGRPLNHTGDYSRDMVKGVRAHIQHLKGYASAEDPRQTIEDPRFSVIVRAGLHGRVTTFDELYLHWAPLSPGYGPSINGIMREMARN